VDIQSTELDLQQVASLFDSPADRDESKVHVSELRDALLETLGIQKPREEELPQWVRNLGSFGLIWEKVLETAIHHEASDRNLRFKRGTFTYEVDGVLGSLDGLITNKEGKPVAVEENKTRWKAEELPTDNDKFMIQGKAYCWMAGVTTCWFPVLNIASRPPNLRQWLHIIEFTPMELAENWKSLMAMKPMVERRKFG
jgi:hypothetical protein